jgi:SAM-dependent methyltransferase
LLDVVDPTDLFGSYRYMTGASPSLVSYADEYAQAVLDFVQPRRQGVVLEIGSNDGTQLASFARRGLRVLGVDPAPLPAATANQRGVRTLKGFFEASLGEDLFDLAPFDLVLANNVMAHIDDLDDVVDLVGELLADNGAFVMEVGYLGDVVAKTLFDVIYHEHLSYHTLTPLIEFFSRHGFAVANVERTAMQGGSIRVYAFRQQKGDLPAPSVTQLLAEEHAARLSTPETFRAFAARIERLRADLRAVVASLDPDTRIWGYGAAAKATTCLYHLDLGNTIETIVDDNPAKQGFYTPGHHIPITSPDQLYVDPPDYLVILAWNFIQHIRREHAAYLRYGGRMIVPLPKIKVLWNM